MLTLLATALKVERIDFFSPEIVLSYSLLRNIGESCKKLKNLDLVIQSTDRPFDNLFPAFVSLESLRFKCFFFCDSHYRASMPKQEREKIESPDFSTFKHLISVENLLINSKWALSLSNAPNLKSIEDETLLTSEELRVFCKDCKNKLICTSLTSLSFYHCMSYYMESMHSPIDDVTGIALLDTFPMLEEIWIGGSKLVLAEPFLTKLKGMKHLKKLNISYTSICFTRAWLGASCKLFPQSLEELEMAIWDEENLDEEEDLQGGTFKEYEHFIEASFRSCLPKLVHFSTVEF